MNQRSLYIYLSLIFSAIGMLVVFANSIGFFKYFSLIIAISALVLIVMQINKDKMSKL